MIVSRRIAPRKRNRSGLRFLFAFAMTTVMIVTGGFGAFPANPLTQMFQQVIAENFPADYLQPFNSYMEFVSVATIQPMREPVSSNESPLDPVGFLAELVATDVPITLTDVPAESPATESTQTTQATATLTLPSATFFPSATATSTVTATATVQSVPFIILPTRTTAPISLPAATSTWTLTSTSTSTFTPTSTSTPTATATDTPTATLFPSIVLYSGGSSIGSIGPRASADAFCPGILPAGYTNSRAFIGYSAADSIANMPANYGIPTNVPVQSSSGTILASNWADLMDGSITQTLSTAGVITGYSWWSGAENADGSFIDGVTPTCNGWTSNLNTVGGNYGDPNSTASAWMDTGTNAACDQMLAILCIGY